LKYYKDVSYYLDDGCSKIYNIVLIAIKARVNIYFNIQNKDNNVRKILKILNITLMLFLLFIYIYLNCLFDQHHD
jgi:hypothetical protein